jgi:ribosomal protein L12E/L44/L45/RPP1/RPP2
MQAEGPDPAKRRSEYEAAVAMMTQLIASLRGHNTTSATSASQTHAAAVAAAAAARDARQYSSAQQCSDEHNMTRQWSDVSDYASVAELSAVRAPKSVRATQPFSHRMHTAASGSSDKLHDGCSGSVASAAAVGAQFCASDATAVRKGHTRTVIECSSVAAAGADCSSIGQCYLKVYVLGCCCTAAVLILHCLSWFMYVITLMRALLQSLYMLCVMRLVAFYAVAKAKVVV